jgi:hypothetical protein
VAWGIVETDGTFSFVERDGDDDDQESPEEGEHTD